MSLQKLTSRCSQYRMILNTLLISVLSILATVAIYHATCTLVLRPSPYWLMSRSNSLPISMDSTAIEKYDDVKVLLIIPNTRDVKYSKRDEDESNASGTLVLNASQEQESSTKSDKSGSFILNQGWFRVVLAVCGLVALQMLCICIHHIYHIATQSSSAYGKVEYNMSPF